jgi:hypothetical protein
MALEDCCCIESSVCGTAVDDWLLDDSGVFGIDSGGDSIEDDNSGSLYFCAITVSLSYCSGSVVFWLSLFESLTASLLS